MAAEKFEQWMVLEIMGHQRYAGLVTEQAVGGASFVRIDVPECGPDMPAFTKLFGGGSIYCMTPVTEAIARGMAKNLRHQPVTVYDLPRLPAPVSTGPSIGEERDWQEGRYEDEDNET